MNRNSMTRGLGLLGLTLALSACSESLSLDAAGQLQMTMQRAGSSLFSPPPANQSETQNRAVAPDTVERFMVTVTSVQVLHASFDSVNGGEWATVQLRSPVRVNLMALGTSDGTARIVAEGNVEAGMYTRIRLTLAQPSIRFKGDVSFGIGGILQGGVDYGVELVGAPTGTIEIAALVEVESGASSSSAVHLVFDQVGTLGNLSLAGNGAVLLTALISQR